MIKGFDIRRGMNWRSIELYYKANVNHIPDKVIVVIVVLLEL